MEPELLKVRHLKKYFPVKAGLMRRTVNTVKAVDDVSLSIKRGETLGLVGESGCGKSTLGRSIMRLIEPTDGEIYFDGRDFRALTYRQLKKERKGIQMIFQDPYASLNPRRNVTELISEPMEINGFFPKAAERMERIKELLNKVDLTEAAMRKYPSRVQRRPAPAHRHSPGPGRGTQIDRGRRAGLGPGCLHPGSGDQSLAGFAGRNEPLVFVHRPRSQRGEAYKPQGGGDVPGTGGGIRAQPGALQKPLASLHQGAFRCHSHPGPFAHQT